MTPRVVLGAGLLLGLALLAAVAPGGELALTAGAAILALHTVPPSRGVRGLAPVLGTLLGVLASVLSLLQTVAIDGPPGLAALARVGCLLSATLLPRTRPPQLTLHVLTLAVALWTATALTLEPTPLTWALSLATLVACGAALASSHARALTAAAEASLIAGLPPGPRQPAPPVLPGVIAAAVGLLPFAAGWELPRPAAPPSPAHRLAARPRPAPTPPPDDERTVGFEPELGFDDPRDGLAFESELVARVRVDPPQPTLLLRGAALEQATAAGFFPRDGAPLDPPLLQPFTRRLQVELHREQRGYLFVLGRPRAIRGVRARARPGGAGPAAGVRYPLRYDVETDDLHPRFMVRGLDPWSAPALLELPPGVDRAQLGALAAEVVGDQDDPYMQARALERWLRARCAYDPAAPLLGSALGEVVTRFLETSRRGICVEFAAALTVLLRAQGIPARVTAGFRTEERDAEGWFVVRTRHAHAWVEVPFEGAGWVAFDATPGSPGHQPFGASSQPSPQDAPSPVASVAGLPSPPPPTPTPTPAPPALAESVTRSPRLLALCLLALVGCGGAAWSSRRHLARRALDEALDASVAPPDLTDARARLFDLLVARGFRPGGSETPTAFVAARGSAQAPLALAVARYTQLRFSGRADPRAERELGALLDAARRDPLPHPAANCDPVQQPEAAPAPPGP